MDYRGGKSILNLLRKTFAALAGVPELRKMVSLIDFFCYVYLLDNTTSVPFISVIRCKGDNGKVGYHILCLGPK